MFIIIYYGYKMLKNLWQEKRGRSTLFHKKNYWPSFCLFHGGLNSKSRSAIGSIELQRRLELLELLLLPFRKLLRFLARSETGDVGRGRRNRCGQENRRQRDCSGKGLQRRIRGRFFNSSRANNGSSPWFRTELRV